MSWTVAIAFAVAAIAIPVMIHQSELKMVLFKRFIIHSKWSDDGLWFVYCKDGSKQHQIFNVAIVDRDFEEGTYYGFQIIVWRWALTVGDLQTFEAQGSEQL
ncbi:MAG: hypothetical protein KME45_03320 [Stenomitos rutilans HA7619-LM2]|jgi:hypothetical protein|nr:hypothetical protein [Stenomitos rutilans HA7619-LM2]MBW4469415.1 hypothetical protein [Stenomitos rutilans HA7619-LM2]